MNKPLRDNGFIGRRNTLWMPVRITDIDTGESYISHNGDDCRSKLDLSGYIEAVASGEVITMGRTVFEPKGASASF
jgi:hypothetical protein